MSVSGSGTAPNSGKGRARLSVRDPLIESLVAGLGDDNLDELRAFCKKIASARNRWDVARRGSGLLGAKLLKKWDADRALRAELKRVKECVE